jgi:hypothetical protein
MSVETTPEKRSYTFVINTAVSLYTEVIAETLEEAIKKAKGRSVQSLCHECASEGADRLGRLEWRIGGEIEGDPASGDLVDLLLAKGGSTEAHELFDEALAIWNRGK